MRDPGPGEAAVPKPEADTEFLVGNGIPPGPAAPGPNSSPDTTAPAPAEQLSEWCPKRPKRPHRA
jgi:hypothetical protein